jgi:hypothetical protein
MAGLSRRRYAKVEYDPHVLVRMRERKIAAAQVERAIANPIRLSPSATVPGRLVAEYETAAGNTLRVVYVEQQRTSGTVAYVITAVRIAGRRT